MSRSSGFSTHQVIVVAAEPAGAYLAYLLARKGIDVLVLEKDRHPRPKSCGLAAGLVHSILRRHLGFATNLFRVLAGETSYAELLDCLAGQLKAPWRQGTLMPHTAATRSLPQPPPRATPIHGHPM